VRRVPDTAARIRIASDGKSIDTSDAEFVINPYEEYALEQAVQLKEKHGGEVTVVTLGPEKTTQVIICLLYTSPSPRDLSTSRMPSSA